MKKDDKMYVEKWAILNALVGIILFNKKGCVVEIGSGSSTEILAKHARNAKAYFYSCDIEKKVDPIFSNHFHFHGSSFDFISQFNDRPSVVFLDGNHDFQIVVKEAEFFLERLVIGGVLFIHDTYPPSELHLNRKNCSNCYKIRQELERKRSVVDCFTWPYTAGDCGLTMVIKKDPNRLFYRA